MKKMLPIGITSITTMKNTLKVPTVDLQGNIVKIIKKTKYINHVVLVVQNKHKKQLWQDSFLHKRKC